MDALVIGWRELLILLGVVLAIYIAEMLLLMRANGNRGLRIWRKGEAARAQSQEIAWLQDQIDDLRAKVNEINDALVHPQHSVEKGDAVNTPYSQAIQMAQKGVTANEVANGCGISRGEAELIVALYKIRT